MSRRTRAHHESAIRAVAHAAVVVLLVLGAYIVVLIPLGGDHAELGPSIVATTLVVAASSYLRPRLDRALDHFVYGDRADAFNDLQRFASGSEEAIDPEAMPLRVVKTAHRLVAARHAQLHLQLPGGRTLQTAFPPDSTCDVIDLVVPIQHDGRVIGLLGVTQQPGDLLSPADERLLHRLAQAASVALDNARLTIELREQVDEIARVVDELQRSSARIVTAGENEQRHIERAIRERVERPLRCALAETSDALAQAATHPDAARQAVRTASTETTEALNALRDVAHGIFPPLLTTEGLVSAMTSRARREGWQVVIVADGLDESLLEPEARSTAYFALVELARASAAATMSIELCARDGFVQAEVTGAPRTTDPALERALERVSILGGTVTERDRGLTIALPISTGL